MHRQPPVGAAHRERLRRRRRPAHPAAACGPPTGCATTTSAAPLQRSGVRSRHSTHQPGGAEQQRPDAERRHRARPRRAGCATHSATAIIQSMPSPISRQNSAVEAERHGEQRRECPSASPRPRRSAWPADWRSRRRARADENGRPRRAWWRARRPATPGSAPTISRPPHSATRAPSERVGAGRDPGQAALVGGDQRQRRRKRHLEARMHDRLRREQQHAEAPPPSSVRKVSAGRSTITPISTMAVMMKERWVATSAPDSSR